MGFHLKPSEGKCKWSQMDMLWMQCVGVGGGCVWVVEVLCINLYRSMRDYLHFDDSD